MKRREVHIEYKDKKFNVHVECCGTESEEELIKMAEGVVDRIYEDERVRDHLLKGR